MVGCPCGFMHCVVFPGLWQGLALICGPDCGSSAGACGAGALGVQSRLAGCLL